MRKSAFQAAGEDDLDKDILSEVNICFAIDDNYAAYLKVALYSLLLNRNGEYFYNILILNTDVSEAHREEIGSLIKKEEKFEIDWLN